MVDEIKLEHLVVIPGRAIDESIVAELAKSFTEVGILNPITVGRDRSVIAGVHRFEAAKRLGWKKIPAVLLEVDELRIRLARIDENLIRNDGTALERAEALRQRKEIYETLHPETKHGGDRASRHNGDLKPARFTEDTAKKAGISERTVQRHVQVAEKLDSEAKETLKAAQLDTGIVDLERLSSLPSEMQRAVATELVKGGKVPRRPQAAMNVEKPESEDNNERFTPRDLITDLHQLYGFTIDVASDPKSPAAQVIGARWTKKNDGLRQSWMGQRVWCNPPFDEIAAWVAKAHAEIEKKCQLVVMLIPATRTEQPFWHEYIEPYRDGRAGQGMKAWELETRFLQGRVSFGNPSDPEGKESGSPLFGCVLLIWRRKDAAITADPRPVVESISTPLFSLDIQGNWKMSRARAARAHAFHEDDPTGALCGAVLGLGGDCPCIDAKLCEDCWRLVQAKPGATSPATKVNGTWRRGKGAAHFHEHGNHAWGSVCGRPFDGTVAIDEPKRPQKCLTCLEYVERQELYRKQDEELAPSEVLGKSRSSPALDDGKRCGIRRGGKGPACDRDQSHEGVHRNQYATWEERKRRLPPQLRADERLKKKERKSRAAKKGKR